jgi:hypothetical protein
MSADSGKTKIFSPQSHCMEQAQRAQRSKTKAYHPRSSAESCVSRCMGRCTAGKLQRILASGAFSQHAKLNMAGFVLYLRDHFGLRCRMVELHPKARKIELAAGEAVSNQHSAKGKTVSPQRTQRTQREEG